MPAIYRLALNAALKATSRLRSLASDQATANLRDWLILTAAGVTAACASTFIKLDLRIPGHAILQVVFPTVLGLALAPRRLAGAVMGGAAAVTAGTLRWAGFGGDGLSLGALTSLVATGPLLDYSLRRPRTGWRLYVSFAAAGLASNLLALAVRGTAKAVGWEHLGGRPMTSWLPQAVVTYTICGLLAGLISGAIWFSASRKVSLSSEEDAK
jgi:hypothetical protein